MAEQKKISTSQALKLLQRQTLNNLNLISMGQEPITVELVGDAGMSKSSIAVSVGKFITATTGEACKVKVINGAEFGTETGALNGFPVVETKYVKTDDSGQRHELWLETNTVCEEDGFLRTNVQRTTTAPPDWVIELFNYKYSILVLDDIGRCQQIIYNALMELILHRKYDGWELPENCVVFTTANHDHNSENVRGEDDAQKSRKLSIHLGSVDIDSWAEYAEGAGVNLYLIEFAKHYWNINLAKAIKNNIRSFTMFAASINTAVNEYVELSGATGRQKVYQTLDECISDIRNCGISLIGESSTNVFINEFITELLSKITKVESAWNTMTVNQLVESFKKDFTGSNVLVSNLQLKRLFRVATKADVVSKEDAEKLSEVIASGIFKNTAILKYYNEINENAKKFVNIRNKNEVAKLWSKAAGITQ